MNIQKHFLHAGVITLFFLTLVFSCTSSKKAAVPCPDFSHKRSLRADYDKRNHQSIALGKDIHFKTGKAFFKSLHPKADQSIHLTGLSLQQQNTAHEDETSDASKSEYLNSLSASLNHRAMVLQPEELKSGQKSLYQKYYLKENSDFGQQACDTIVFKMGNLIIGEVTEIGVSEIKYKECGSVAGSVTAILKSDVFVIKHSDGTRDYFYSENPITTQTAVTNQYVRQGVKTEGLGLTGFITSLVALFIAGIPLGTLSVIFGLVSLGKIRRHPEKYKGKGFAHAAIIIGFIDVVGVMILMLAGNY